MLLSMHIDHNTIHKSMSVLTQFIKIVLSKPFVSCERPKTDIQYSAFYAQVLYNYILQLSSQNNDTCQNFTFLLECEFNLGYGY